MNVMTTRRKWFLDDPVVDIGDGKTVDWDYYTELAVVGGGGVIMTHCCWGSG